MKIAVIYGTQRRESTYHLAHLLLDALGREHEVSEFFLPKDMPNYCRGCFACFTDESNCPDYAFTRPALRAMEQADLLVLTTPGYVCHASGQMKTFLDHFAYQWMVHRPNAAMFSKQAVILATAAGAGTRSAMKDIKDSTDFWGVGKTYCLGQNVAAAGWQGVSPRIKERMERRANVLAHRIRRRKKDKPCVKVRVLYYAMRLMHKKMGFNPADVAYWKDKGWLDQDRPW